MAKSHKSRGKMPALITYAVAVVFLVFGLTVPLQIGSFTGGGVDFSKMPLMQFTGALTALGVPGISFGSPLEPVFGFSPSLFGTSFNFGAVLLILYALVTVAAVIALIPVCVAKKKSRSVRKVVAVMELIALTALLPLCALAFAKPAAEWNISVFAAAAVTVIMLIVQSIVYFGKSGVIKTVTFLLSSVALFFGVANAADNLPFLSEPLNNFIYLIKGSRPFETTAGLYLLNGKVIFGSTLIRAVLTDPASLAWNVGAAIVNYMALSLSLLVCLNMFLNLLGLGKSTNRFTVNANVARYIIEFALLVAVYIALFATGGSFGFALYILTIIALAQLIIAFARYLRYKSVLKRAEDADEDADVADADEEYEFGDAAPASGTRAPAANPPGAVVETRDVVYNVNTIYNGPSDGFIRKLTNEEKVEFARVFLERSSGSLTMIPDYIVGGENSKFFSSIFIYLASVRNIVTDGLMNKLYEEAVRTR